MATTDLLTLAEAKTAINLTGTGTTLDTILGLFVSAVSDVLDSICGPVVTRSITEAFDPPGYCVGAVELTEWVSWPTDNWSLQTVTSLTEYIAGVGTVLTGETSTVAGGYIVRGGFVNRRGTFAPSIWRGPFSVTYTAGRYATTSSVGARFKLAATEILAREWPQYAAAWSKGAGIFGGAPEGGFGYFKSVDPVVEQWLRNDRRMAGAA